VDGPAQMERLKARWPDLFPDLDWLKDLYIERWFTEGFLQASSQARTLGGQRFVSNEALKMPARRFFQAFQNWLRSIWIAKDMRLRFYLASPVLTSLAAKKRLWKWFSAKLEDFADSPVCFDPLPKPKPFERAIWHLVYSIGRSRRCQNRECPAPYFWARRRTQKFCSSICAGPAKRKAKRRWWRKNRGKKKKVKPTGGKR